jgi:8-oxo-dGTP diphosphatase
MNLQVGVKLILQNAQGQILLLKRSSQYGHLAESWDVPGGRIQPEEDLASALVREVYEEIGIKLAGLPQLIAAQDIFSTDKDIHVVRLTYLLMMNADDIRLSEEHTVHAWVTTEQAQSLPLEPLLKQVLESLPS